MQGTRIRRRRKKRRGRGRRRKVGNIPLFQGT